MTEHTDTRTVRESIALTALFLVVVTIAVAALAVHRCAEACGLESETTEP